MFTRMLRHARPAPERFTELAGDLFKVMATGGRVGFKTVAWFNGGLFDDGVALPLEKSDIETVLAASDLDWSEIDPSILGTLFERGLDPGKRAQLGAHYTDRDKIMLLGRTGGDPPVADRVGSGEGRDHGGAGTCGSRQVQRRADETAERGRAPAAGVSRAAAQVHGTRTGVRLGQLPRTGLATEVGRSPVEACASM